METQRSITREAVCRRMEGKVKKKHKYLQDPVLGVSGWFFKPQCAEVASPLNQNLNFPVHRYGTHVW